jgi:DNA-binding HxlR family transcriptional regulator
MVTSRVSRRKSPRSSDGALIVCELSPRSMRYNEIESALCYVSHRVLTYELQILLKGGVISRSNVDGNLMAPRYSLTSRGCELYVIFQDALRGINGTGPRISPDLAVVHCPEKGSS